MEQEELIKEIAGILDKLGIRYLITGGIAVVIWGRPRFTADVDVVVEMEPRQVDKLADEFSRLDAEMFVDKDMMREAFRQGGEFNIIHPASGLKIDFWLLQDEPFDRGRMKRRVGRKIGKQIVYFSSPEDLILIKLRWYKESDSTRQLEDIESILRIQKDLDFEYLQKWTRIQSTSDVLESVMGKFTQR